MDIYEGGLNIKIIKMIYLLRRFAAFYIDNGILFFVTTFVYLLKERISGISLDEIVNPDTMELLIYHILLFFFYFFICEIFFFRTIGKILFKLKINGFSSISLKKRMFQSLIRNLARLIPFEPFSIFLDEEKRMWHDMVAKTNVIDGRKKINEMHD